MDIDLLRRRLELTARLLETAAAQSHKRLQKIDDAQQILADVLKSLPAPGVAQRERREWRPAAHPPSEGKGLCRRDTPCPGVLRRAY